MSTILRAKSGKLFKGLEIINHLFPSTMLGAEDNEEDLEDVNQDTERHPQTGEVPTKPIDKPTERDN